MRTITNDSDCEYVIDENGSLVSPLRIGLGVDEVFTRLEEDGRDSLYRYLADQGGFAKLIIGEVTVETVECDELIFLIYGNASTYLPAPPTAFDLIVPDGWDEDVAQYVKEDWEARLKGDMRIDTFWRWINQGDFDAYGGGTYLPPFAPAESWELAGIETEYSDEAKTGLLGLRWKSQAHMLRAWAAVGAPVIPPKW